MKNGDRVIQINLDYYKSKIGWVGTIVNTFDNKYVYVKFDKYSEQILYCNTRDLKLINPNNKRQAYNAKNIPNNT